MAMAEQGERISYDKASRAPLVQALQAFHDTSTAF